MASSVCTYAITDSGRVALQSLPPRQKIRRQVLEALLAKPYNSFELARIARASRAHIRECLANAWIMEQAPPRESHEFVVAHPLNEEQSNALDQAATALKGY